MTSVHNILSRQIRDKRKVPEKLVEHTQKEQHRGWSTVALLGPNPYTKVSGTVQFSNVRPPTVPPKPSVFTLAAQREKEKPERGALSPQEEWEMRRRSTTVKRPERETRQSGGTPRRQTSCSPSAHLSDGKSEVDSTTMVDCVLCRKSDESGGGASCGEVGRGGPSGGGCGRRDVFYCSDSILPPLRAVSPKSLSPDFRRQLESIYLQSSG